MTGRSFILSAQLRADALFVDPTLAAAIVELADHVQLDLLLLGEITAAAETPSFDPLIAAAWLASRAGGVALIASVSALHAEPFHVARALSALDFLTAGRCGWHPTVAGANWQRYGAVGRVPDGEVVAKAVDFVAATRSLWDSWDADALIIDQTSGAYLHADRVRRGNYQGPYHRVLGPLNAARPPQGHPILLQTEVDQSAVAISADIRVINRGALTAGDAVLRLLRCGVGECTSAYLASLVKLWQSRQIDGIHLELPAPIADLNHFGTYILPELSQLAPLSTDSRRGLLRSQFGLKIPPIGAMGAGARRGHP